jgi:hypothetical protein
MCNEGNGLMSDPTKPVIDPTKPVKLLRHVFKNGNSFHPGTYRPGELPSEFLVEGVVTQGDTNSNLAPRYTDIGRQVNIDLQTSSPNTLPTTFNTLPTPVIATQTPPAVVPATTPARIEINTAPLDRMTIAFGAIAANQISVTREKKAFVDLADLKKRVIIKELDWDKFSDQIIF